MHHPATDIDTLPRTPVNPNYTVVLCLKAVTSLACCLATMSFHGWLLTSGAQAG